MNFLHVKKLFGKTLYDKIINTIWSINRNNVMEFSYAKTIKAIFHSER
jgi:hypothetical protein